MMACFVEVTVRASGKRLLVNMDLITSMQAEAEGACLWRSGAEIHVAETPGQIVARMSEVTHGQR